MKNFEFDKDNPQDWLKKVNSAFTTWIQESEKQGGQIRFNKNFIFTIPKSKTNQKENTFPIKTDIIYSAKDLNSIYMIISESVRVYMKS